MLTAEWFEDAVRPDAVVPVLTDRVPEFADGSLALLRCRVTRIRSLPDGESWTATYELDLRDPESGLERTFAARGTLTPPGLPLATPARDEPFGAESWRCVLPELRLHLRSVAVDDALPGFAQVTDPEQARLLLEESLSGLEGLPDPFALDRCVCEVAAHKPGVRATVICRLGYAGDRPSGPTAVVVKLHHDDEGKRAHEAMRALYASLGSNALGGLARPLAYLPELRLSIQEYVDHRLSLKDLFHHAFESRTPDAWAELVDATRATAAGLAQLHRSGCEYGEPVTWADESKTLRKKYDRLAAVMPALGDVAGPALDRVESAAAGTDADPLGPAHHSFRPAQVLLSDGAVSFIDFDKFCQAEPASDIAALTTKLLHMGVNKVDAPDHQDAERDREARVGELRGAFLEEYRRHGPVADDRVTPWEALELVSLVLSAVKKANGSWVESCSHMLEHHLDAHGI